MYNGLCLFISSFVFLVPGSITSVLPDFSSWVVLAVLNEHGAIASFEMGFLYLKLEY